MSPPCWTGLGPWQARYAELLHARAGQPDEELLRQAGELGRALAEAGVPFTDVATAHLAALEELEAPAWQHAPEARQMIRAATAVFSQLSAAYGTSMRDAEAELTRYRQRLEELVAQRTLELNEHVQAELAERQRTEEALRHREAILEAVAFAAQCFLKAASWRDDIDQVLERLGRAVEASRAYVFEHHAGPAGERVVSQRYEWSRPGISAQIDNLGLQNVPCEGGAFQRWDDLLRRNKPVWGHVREFPVCEQEVLAPQGIRSLVAMPIFVGAEPWGLVGFDECAREREWSAPEIEALKAAAATLGAAIQGQRVEEALRESKEYLDKIINSIRDPIFVKDRQHRLVLVNDAECALTGHRREEVVGRTDYEFFPREQVDVFWEKDEAVFGTGEENVNEEEITDATGSTRTIVTKKTLYTDKAGNKFIVGIVRDITERKRAEEAARRHQEQLTHVARVCTIGEMASGLAHELAQPLSAMLYYAKGCVTRLGTGEWGPAEAAKAMQKIAAQAERAGEFIRHLKDFVREAQPCRVPSGINAIVNEAVRFAAPEAQQGQVTIRLALAENLPNVVADTVQIEQVLLNLLRNGIDAMERTPPAERELVIQTARGPDNTVQVSVRDAGRGLTPELATQVFDPFFTTKPGGTGLGLSISRSIIEAHEGELWVRPDPLHGSTFGCTLPAAKGTGHAGE